MRFKKSVYYSFGDIAELEDASWSPNSSSTPFLMSTLMTRYGLQIEDSSNDKLAIFYQLMRMNFSRYYEFALYKTFILPWERIEDIVIDASTLKEIWRRFVNLFDLTAPRYIPLLNSYKSNEANPIKKIGSTTTGINRFNDTPQNGGDFSDDAHTTTINQNEVEVLADTGSVAERLDELYKNWRSVLKDWTSEFRCLFYANIWEEWL